MKTISFTLVILFFIVAAGCSPKNPGAVTLVNSDIETLKISIDGRNFTIRPTNHITKEVEAGPHEIKVENSTPVKVQVSKGLTTLFDSSGLSCFVVADFTDAYHGGEVKIVQKFEHQPTFTTKDKMATVLGSTLPLKLHEGEKALRLQQIDCEAIGNDAEIAASLSLKPE